MENLKEKLLNTLEKLKEDEFKKFKWFLELDDILEGFKGIPMSQLEKADRPNTVDLMVQKHQDHGALQLTMKVLEKLRRNDLVQHLQNSHSGPKAESGLQDVSDYKRSLRKKCQHVTKGNDEDERTLLNIIFTELHLTEGKRKETRHVTSIKRQDIFEVLPDQQEHIIEVVLTNGLAGVGKTFLVQKFTLDWAEGSENQDVSLVIPLSFRELNSIKDEQYSLLTLIHNFHPTLQKVTAEKLESKDCKVLFIFDGLDESTLKLDFNNRKEDVSDVTQKSSINVLLTNLIKKNLLPSALIWITSQPAAAKQIPRTYVNRVTEVRGFTDAQKEEYFRKRFSDEDQSSKIISHIKTSRILHIMCTIPVICWIIATVLEHMLRSREEEELPETLTDMFSHFLLVQTKRTRYAQRHGIWTCCCRVRSEPNYKLKKADREVLLKLGKLAFEQLEKGNIMFSQEDLEQCGLDVTETSVLSGFCTEIFKRESGVNQKAVYSFVHRSVQEFLAAVYIYDCYNNRKTKVLNGFMGEDHKYKKSKLCSCLRAISACCRCNCCCDLSLDVFLMAVMEKSLKSKTGHLDLFVCFLHGLSLKSNQKLLGGLLHWTENSQEIIQRVIDNLKKMNTEDYVVVDDGDISPDKSIIIRHCLMEMNESSVRQEIPESDNRSEVQCSDHTIMLPMSMDEPHQKKSKKSGRGGQSL